MHAGFGMVYDCPFQDLTNMRNQFQHMLCSAPPSSASRPRYFLNQALFSLQLSCPRRQSAPLFCHHFPP
eukprot:1160094-Pelagomonas_calceolata.AAC.1